MLQMLTLLGRESSRRPPEEGLGCPHIGVGRRGESNLAWDWRVRVELSAVLKRLPRLSPAQAPQCPKCPLGPLLGKFKAKASTRREEVDLRGGKNFKSARASHDKAQSKQRKVAAASRPRRPPRRFPKTSHLFRVSSLSHIQLVLASAVLAKVRRHRRDGRHESCNFPSTVPTTQNVISRD